MPNVVTKYVIFCELWENISVPDIHNLGLVMLHVTILGGRMRSSKLNNTLFPTRVRHDLRYDSYV